MSEWQASDEATPKFKASFSWQRALILLLLVSLFGLPLLPDLLQWRRDARILREGTAAKARILEARPTGDEHNDQPEVSLALEVQPAGAAPFSATLVTYLSPVYLPRFQPGAVVDVRFDPEKPSDVVLVGP